MNSKRLSNYASNLQKIAQANARDDQMQAIRSSRFKASLVEDPLRSAPNLVHVFDTVRTRTSK